MASPLPEGWDPTARADQVKVELAYTAAVLSYLCHKLIEGGFSEREAFGPFAGLR